MNESLTAETRCKCGHPKHYHGRGRASCARCPCEGFESRQGESPSGTTSEPVVIEPQGNAGESPATLSSNPMGRDSDWILAMGHALGLKSGYEVPIVPEVEPFKELFAEIRRRAHETRDDLVQDVIRKARQWRAVVDPWNGHPKVLGLCAAIDALDSASEKASCVCGHPELAKTVHRTDGPCFMSDVAPVPRRARHFDPDGQDGGEQQ